LFFPLSFFLFFLPSFPPFLPSLFLSYCCAGICSQGLLLARQVLYYSLELHLQRWQCVFT
jgi:hypothetical protein